MAIPSAIRRAGVFNAALLIGRDGRPLLNYRKSHLFGGLDRAMFRAGDGPLQPVA